MSKIVNNHVILLLATIVLAAILRLYAISSVPVSLYWDETAIGYNAYSIAQTGKDEYGKSFPLLFQSFDDYKMPGYIYITAIFVSLFGLSELSVRIASALFGIGSVVVTYFLVLEIFSLEKTKNKISELLQKHKIQTSLLSSLLLAISPWHLQFSRTGFEANGGLFFLIVGVYLFLVGRRKVQYFFLSFLAFALGMYFYRSLYIFIPLILFALSLTFFTEYMKVKKRYLVGGILFFFLLLVPIIPQMLSDKGLARAKQVSISNDLEQKLINSSQLIAANGNRLIDRVMYNRRLIRVETFLSNYFSHFSFDYLFIKGDTNGRHDVINTGVLYKWEIPFIILGLLLLIFLPKKTKTILLVWLLIAPLAASLSSPNPHALRSLNILPIPMILTSIGIIYILSTLSRNVRILVSSVLFVAILGTSILYLHSYYTITPIRTADDWADGYKQLVNYISERENKYDKIIITGAYWQPYIYFLFYQRYDPTQFQQYGTAEAFGKYYFGGTNWDKEKGIEGLDKKDLQSLADGKKSLIVLSEDEYKLHKEKLKKIDVVTNHFGKTRFIITETIL